jgi:hypothetical protein
MKVAIDVGFRSIIGLPSGNNMVLRCVAFFISEKFGHTHSGMNGR